MVASIVGRKKDPNRFASKEFAGIIEPADDGGWATAPAAKGTGWGHTLETWGGESDKWGTEDRQWGNKEGTWDKLIVDDTDKDSWPQVNSKGAAVANPTRSSSDPEKGKNAACSSAATSALSNSPAVANLPQTSSSSKGPNSARWQGHSFPVTGESWDVACDDSLDKAIDAAEAANDNVAVSGFGSVSCGVLGGLIGSPSNWDSSLTSKESSAVHSEDQAKAEKVNKPSLENSVSSSKAETPKWSKTPGKVPKTEFPVASAASTFVSTSSWGGTPAEKNSGWIEPSLNSNTAATSGPSSAAGWQTPDTAQGPSAPKKASDSGKVDVRKASKTSGWGTVSGTVSESSSNWDTPGDVTGASCWDSRAAGSVSTNSETRELKADDKVSQWLQNSDISGSATSGWGQDSREPDECSEGSGDGWTTASAKRNRVRQCGVCH